MPSLPSLTLHDIRSHHEREFSFGDLTVLVGANGSGKTNVLEAVSVLSTTRSWRAKSEVELVAWGAEFGRIKAGSLEVVIARHPYGKSFWLDGVRLRAKEVVGTLRTVLFQPDDLALVTGAPQYRRHFLNVVLSQQDHNYSAALLDYAKAITQRNRLLKRMRDGQATEDELVFWDRELIRLSEIIWQARAGLIDRLSSGLTDAYREVSGDGAELSVRHETKPHDPSKLAEELVAIREREIILGQTLRGPHRDDLHFLLNGYPAVTVASRGELRSLTFALKMIELDYLSGGSRYGEATASPSQPLIGTVLLLDDIMSELDANRRRRLVEAAQRCQTILTTTDLDDVPAELRETATIINF